MILMVNGNTLKTISFKQTGEIIQDLLDLIFFLPFFKLNQKGKKKKDRSHANEENNQ